MDPHFSFGMIADVQYCDGEPWRERFFRESADKLRQAIDTFNQRKLDFVIHLGDTVDKWDRSYADILPVFSEIKVPHYHITGNHDFEEIENYTQAEIFDLLSIPTRGYRSFTHQKWRFILLDGTEISTFSLDPEKRAQGEKMLPLLKKTGLPQAEPWNAAIGSEQFFWLREQLDASAAEGEEIILCCHYPIFPANDHNLWNDSEILSLISLYPHVKLWLNGHQHAGNYGQYEHIHCLTAVGMVEKHSSAYAIVNVYDNWIEIEGFGREVTRAMAI